MGRGQQDRLAAPEERVGELREPHRRGWDVLSRLGRVVAVVEAQADDLLRVGHGSEQLDRVELEPPIGVGRAPAESEQPVRIEGLEQAAHRVAGRVERERRDDLLAELHARVRPAAVVVGEQAHGPV